MFFITICIVRGIGFIRIRKFECGRIVTNDALFSSDAFPVIIVNDHMPTSREIYLNIEKTDF